MTSDSPDCRGGGTSDVAAGRQAQTADDTFVLRTGRQGRSAGLPVRAPLIPAWAPIALLLLAVPFVRPNIMGEEQWSPAGFAFLMAAAGAALLRRPDNGARRRGLPDLHSFEPAAVLIVCVGLAYFSVLLSLAATNPGRVAWSTLQGMLVTVGSLVAIAMVCREPRARVAVARGFVILIAVLCTSYAVTALIWAAIGVGSGQVGAFPVGTFGPQPLYLPFTTTAGTQSVFGISFPRFTGIGREPGWMAMYCAIAYFLAETAGIRSRPLKLVLLVGLVGCISTAGFGVFVVAWAYHRFLRDRGETSLGNYFRQVGGLGVVALAIWLAVAAPVLGLAAKSTQNSLSLDERRAAMEAGVRAFHDNPWGGDYSNVNGGVNLIAAIAVSGLPSVLLIVLGLLLTMARFGPVRSSNAIVMIVLLTMLTSQPPMDSTWAFGLVVLACTLRRPDTQIPDALRVSTPSPRGATCVHQEFPDSRPDTPEGRRSTGMQTAEESP